MQDLLIFPFSGNAIEALDCLGPEWNCIGFISDDETKIGNFYAQIPIFDRSVFTKFSKAKVLAVPGSPKSYLQRRQVIEHLNIGLERFISVIHPKAIVSPQVTLGYNILIMAGVVLTSNVKIGNHVCILPNTVVHHDSKVGDYTLIGAQVTISGNVNIGENCYIGASSNIINNCNIGDFTLIGMGSNVIKNIDACVIAVGNPAKPIKLISDIKESGEKLL